MNARSFMEAFKKLVGPAVKAECSEVLHCHPDRIDEPDQRRDSQSSYMHARTSLD
jgi:hypothetical protein